MRRPYTVCSKAIKDMIYQGRDSCAADRCILRPTEGQGMIQKSNFKRSEQWHKIAVIFDDKWALGKLFY